ncbi:phage head morphogenesis protein [Shewanella halifaxensis]|uniref:phage head morphogenesis protein n=1 Tax=Shewanella halifaxensis TaxID=271098 RepID=UPI000D59522F|nr:minor capsid protein [Shewanella halifaxensis]
MPLKQLESRSKRDLKKMEGLENQALAFTASKLSELIKSRFEKQTVITNAQQLSFARFFTDSMVLAWLYGQKHVIDNLQSEIKLSNELVSVEFTEAIDYLKSTIPMESKSYQQLEANLKLRAFTIASVVGEDAVNRVKRVYQDTLADGTSKSEAMQRIDGMLEQAGVSHSNPYWLELHYRNNMMTAYNAGRWTQVAHNDLVEYLMYSSVMDDGTTKLCKHLNQTVKLKTDPFWSQYYPPNHHKCRATVMAISTPMYESLPASVKRHSSSVTPSALNDNPTYKAEHQFKSSVTAALERLPASLMTKAKEHQLVPDIIKQTAKENKGVIAFAQTTAASKTLSKSAVNKATSKINKPELSAAIETTTSTAEEIWYGLHIMRSGDAVAALHFVKSLSKELYSVARANAFSGEVQAVSVMDKQQLSATLEGCVKL